MRLRETLRELLEGKTLPIKIKHHSWKPKSPDNLFFNTVLSVGKRVCFVQSDNGNEFTRDLSDPGWEIYEPPRPRLKAWIIEDGSIRFHAPNEELYKGDRAPWLDEPEDK